MTGLLVHVGMLPLSSVTIPLEVEPQLEDAVGKLAAKAVSVRVLLVLLGHKPFDLKILETSPKFKN